MSVQPVRETSIERCQIRIDVYGLKVSMIDVKVVLAASTVSEFLTSDNSHKKQAIFEVISSIQ